MRNPVLFSWSLVWSLQTTGSSCNFRLVQLISFPRHWGRFLQTTGWSWGIRFVQLITHMVSANDGLLLKFPVCSVNFPSRYCWWCNCWVPASVVSAGVHGDRGFCIVCGSWTVGYGLCTLSFQIFALTGVSLLDTDSGLRMCSVVCFDNSWCYSLLHHEAVFKTVHWFLQVQCLLHFKYS
jgi:hypothetical protein